MRKVIHQLKYAGKKEIGRALGRIMANEMQESNFFDGIDLIIPIPLHPKRLRERGYNQSEWIAKGISDITHLPILTTAVQRTKHIESQTHKTPFERWENVQNIFYCNSPEDLENKHILLVDDVLTTGSTATACMESLSNIKGIKQSFISLSVAEH